MVRLAHGRGNASPCAGERSWPGRGCAAVILSIGEILFDHFPDRRRVGGAPFNFSYHLRKLGYPVRFVTRVGDDPEGQVLADLLARSGFSAGDLQLDERYPTGRVKVSLDGKGVPAFEILTDVAFDHLEMTATVQAVLHQGPGLVYFGTLLQRSGQGQRFMEKVFAAGQGAARFLCDVNLRPGCYTRDTVAESLHRADILKLNAEELAEIAAMFWTAPAPDHPCQRLREEFGIELVSLTRGEEGSEIFSERGRFATGPVPPPAMEDTVGAGDAYAAVLAIGYLEKWDPGRILSVASRFAADICGLPGALPEDDAFYLKYAKEIRGEASDR